MISASQLVKTYGTIKALDHVSLEISPGEICGILGPNGAGKTTLFKILCGLVSQDSGTYNIQSKKVKAIGAIIEKPALFEYISAKHNLKVLSRIQGASTDRKTIEEALDLVGLPLDRNDPVRHFSLGMKQRLGLATALINDPDCLILDEPFLGLDPVAMQSLSILIKKLAREKNKAILISSHLLGELTKTCDTLKIIQHGQIVQSGTTSEILNQSTRRFMICGKELEKSNLLKKIKVTTSGDCVTLDLEVAKAPEFLQSIVSEGNEITYFGPEMNLSQLYGEA
jgi:ABC-2 type transport system ATP-binding protein